MRRNLRIQKKNDDGEPLTVQRLYGVIVGRCGVAPAYFFNEMEMDEAQALILALEDEIKERWNQTRFICHSIYQIMSKKPLALKDIIAFPWEKQKRKRASNSREEWLEAFKDVDTIKKKLNIE